MKDATASRDRKNRDDKRATQREARRLQADTGKPYAQALREVRQAHGSETSDGFRDDRFLLITGPHKSGLTSLALMLATRALHGPERSHRLLVVTDEPQQWRHLGDKVVVPDVETALAKVEHPRTLIVVDAQAHVGCEDDLGEQVGDQVRLVVVHANLSAIQMKTKERRGWRAMVPRSDSRLLLPRYGDTISYNQLLRLRAHPHRGELQMVGVNVVASRATRDSAADGAQLRGGFGGDSFTVRRRL